MTRAVRLCLLLIGTSLALGVGACSVLDPTVLSNSSDVPDGQPIEVDPDFRGNDSILSRQLFLAVRSDLLNLGAEIKLLESSGVQLVHFDVMDGCFCPMTTVGPPAFPRLRVEVLFGEGPGG